MFWFLSSSTAARIKHKTIYKMPLIINSKLDIYHLNQVNTLPLHWRCTSKASDRTLASFKSTEPTEDKVFFTRNRILCIALKGKFYILFLLPRHEGKVKAAKVIYHNEISQVVT